jgi:hypothetical protein
MEVGNRTHLKNSPASELGAKPRLSRGGLWRPTVAELRKLAATASREQFCRQVASLWLMHLSDTSPSAPPAPDEMPWTPPLTEGAGPAPTRRMLRASGPEAYSFQQLGKSSDNVWASRILVGRAGNNDVVIRDPSLSRLHAYLAEVEEGLRIWDAKSRNGTWLDNERVPAFGPGREIRAGSSLRLGHVSCSVLGSDELYAMLSRRR